MLEVRLDFPLRFYDENEFDCNLELISKLLDKKTFSCRLADDLITYSTAVRHHTKITERNSQSVLLRAYREYLVLHSENEDIKKKLVEKENEKTTSREIIITLTGQVDAEVDIENNYFILPSMKRPSLEEIVEKDLCTPLLFKQIDEHLIPTIHQIATNFLIALLLSDSIFADFMTGKYVLYLNGRQYEDYRLIEFDGDMVSAAVPDSKVGIEDCWKWICNNTMMGVPGKKEPVYFTVLSYLLNRYDYEALLYSVIGLESLFTEPKSRNISYQLKKNIAAVFPSLQEADLNKVYKLRSKFVHAGSDISFLDSFIGFANDSTLKESLELASAILIESIRLLIRSQASRFVFKETTSYSLC